MTVVGLISLFVTLISLIGYVFLHKYPGSEVTLKNLHGQHLWIRVIGCGVGFLVFSYFIVNSFCLICFLFWHYTDDFWLELFKGWFSIGWIGQTIFELIKISGLVNQYFSKNILGYEFFLNNIQLFIAIIMSFALAYWVAAKRLERIQRSEGRYFSYLRKKVLEYYGQLDLYIFDITREILSSTANAEGSGRLIQFSLSTGKVYIGYPYEFNLFQKEDYIKIIPMISGYRHSKKLTLELTTYYNPVYDIILSSESESEGMKGMSVDNFVVLIPVSQIISVSAFDPEVYDHFENFNNK